MRNLLALLGASLLLFIGLGWYLGWYRFQTAPTDDGQRQINIKLNTKKIQDDVGKAGKKAKDALEDLLDSDDSDTRTVVAPKSVEARPTGLQGGIRFDEDGGVTYQGGVNIPVIPPAPK